MTESADLQKILAKKRRHIMELAGQIHDVVEETLWSDYGRLPELSQTLQVLIIELESFRQEHGL